MPRTFPCFALLVSLCLTAAVRGNSLLAWERIVIDAHLLDSGAVEVVERMSVKIEGDFPQLSRPLSTAPDQTIRIRAFVREDESGDHPLKDGDRREQDQYDFTDEILTWGVRAAGGEWKGEVVKFRLEYELRNALAPAWDVPLMPDRFGSWGDYWEFPSRLRKAFAIWQEAGTGVARRYRYEHEIRFPPFPAEGPAETTYNVKYDKAWRLLHPDRDIGRGADEHYRASMLFEYLGAGLPPQIDWWKPALRMGSMVAVFLLALLLSVGWLVTQMIRRGTIRRRLDYRWFEEKIASIRPEALARQAGRAGAISFPDFLARLRNMGVIAVDDVRVGEDEDPKVRMRLLNASARLEPFEREMLRQLFPKGPDSGTDVLRAHYREKGEEFDPRFALMDALHEQYGSAPTESPFSGGLAGSLAGAFLAAGAGLLLYAVFGGTHEWRVAMRVLTATCFLYVPTAALAVTSLDWKLKRSMFWPVGIALGLCAAMFVQQFATNVPFTALGSLGLALVCASLIIKFFLVFRYGENTPQSKARLHAAYATAYVGRQLRRDQPALSDAWVPHILALGQVQALSDWMKRARNHEASFAGAPGEHPPFRGIWPAGPGIDWEEALSVYPDESEPEPGGNSDSEQ